MANKIGKGLQYVVYDYGDRVLKIPRSIYGIIFTLFKWAFFEPSYLFFNKHIKNLEHSRVNSITGIKSRKIKPSLLGNPVFDGNNIWQDKAIPLKKLIKSEENLEKIFRDYAIFIKECWKYGFQDRIFNFGINYGLDRNEKIILLDFGELTFDKREVAKLISSHHWTKSHDYNFLLNKEQKKLYLKIMESYLTLTDLDKFWRTKV